MKKTCIRCTQQNKTRFTCSCNKTRNYSDIGLLHKGSDSNVEVNYEVYYDTHVLKQCIINNIKTTCPHYILEFKNTI